MIEMLFLESINCKVYKYEPIFSWVVKHVSNPFIFKNLHSYNIDKNNNETMQADIETYTKRKNMNLK